MPKINHFTYLGKTGFDNEKYLNAQSDAIIERASKFDKLYLEFGGKLIFDYHAARVLPGYHLNGKIEVIRRLAAKRPVEFLLCINARDIQSGRKMGALGINYRDFSLKMIDSIKEYGFEVPGVCINLFSGEPAAKELGSFLKKQGYNVYYRGLIEGYPENFKKIASPAGFGKKPFIKTNKPIVIVTGAGPNSGKLATCLTLVYQDYLGGKDSGYAKMESFPVWNLPLDSPVNVAYEAATADIADYNLIDPFHLKAYGVKAVNYNRDVAAFPIIHKMLNAIVSPSNFMLNYKSPTDMGVNHVGKAIANLEICEKAARQEIIRRYFNYCSDSLSGTGKEEAAEIVEKLMKKHKIRATERQVVGEAREAAEKSKEGMKLKVGCAIMLQSGEIVTGKNSPMMHAESAAILNALKKMAGVPKADNVLVPTSIHQIRKMRKKMYAEESENLNISEVLMLLAINANEGNGAEKAFSCLEKLNSCELHTTHVLSRDDQAALRALGVNYTSDGKMELGRLYIG